MGTSKLNYLDPRISVSWYVSLHTHTDRHMYTHRQTDTHCLTLDIEHFLLSPPPGVRSGTSPWRRCTTKLSARSLPGPLTWQTRPLSSESGPLIWIGVFSSFILHSRGELSYNLVMHIFLNPSIPFIYVLFITERQPMFLYCKLCINY